MGAYCSSATKQARCLPCGHTLCAACLGMCRSISSSGLLRRGCSTDYSALKVDHVLRQAPCLKPLQMLETVQPAEQSYHMISCQAFREYVLLKNSANKCSLVGLVGSSLLLTWSLPMRCLDRELQQECKLEDYASEMPMSRYAIKQSSRCAVAGLSCSKETTALLAGNKINDLQVAVKILAAYDIPEAAMNDFKEEMEKLQAVQACTKACRVFGYCSLTQSANASAQCTG